MRAREVNARIERLGGVQVRQRGSHRLYKVETTNDGGAVIATATTIVAQHAGDILAVTLRKIEKDVEPVLGERWLTR